MDIHNTTEELVIAEVNAICDSLAADEKQSGICTCGQCRQDVACYVLNRVEPHYIVSHRGMSRFIQGMDTQKRADLTTLAYEGIKQVNHNQRPYFDHKELRKDALSNDPVFKIPTIMGRVFNGLNFSPVTDVTVELFQNGELAVMKDTNWQNPYVLIPNTGGTFTFLPKPAEADKPDAKKVFEFAVKITGPDYDELNHVFAVVVKSELANLSSSMSRTFKLPDLYLFPPGEEKQQLVIVAE